jgi:hypothetical protein
MKPRFKITRLLRIVSLTLAGTLTAYVVAYFALVVPGKAADFVDRRFVDSLRRATAPVTVRVEREQTYRIRGEFVEMLFSEANHWDRRLRPGRWSEEITFAPMPLRPPASQSRPAAASTE